MSPMEISKKYKITRQSILMKIKEGRIQAINKYGRWYMNESDFLDYLRSKYKRNYLDNGVPIFNDQTVSVNEASHIINRDTQHVYYQIRTGKIKAKKQTTTWTINISDLEKYQQYLVEKRHAFLKKMRRSEYA